MIRILSRTFDDRTDLHFPPAFPLSRILQSGFLPPKDSAGFTASALGLELAVRLLAEAGFSDLPLPCRGGNGRPYFPGCPDFNITHTGHTVLCALLCSDLHPDGKIGIDAEEYQNRSPVPMERVSRRWFTAEEQEIFEKDPKEETFLRVWTGKESIVKQSGEGFAGLSRADTLSPPPGLCLNVFPLGNGILTVCAPAGETIIFR